ncbi:putative glutamate--tRNA ligase, cytoplasmic [Tetrabaena socialis]|uniref:glutamate--tRNA ligase n=1 Tax=Tetrabaena socialis TaxID=47790 RepID=A0A2J8AB97_9CHLO|nr:putative glutamate--tRNA ligase, cytoplasmic [Tetrabaena socialis]|eukprot:PNH09799.1 putative glutamate--tRNA ligase, cytoplasmic [Tetrabaena socialis]
MSATLSFWERNPPYAALAIARLGEVPVAAVPDPKATKETIPTLSVSGESFTGTMILKYLARASTKRDELYGSDALVACQVDNWLDTASGIVSGAALESQCSALNDYLTLRTFLVGYNLTIADLAVWGQLHASPLWKKVRTGGKVPHLARWFTFCSEVPQVRSAVEELEALGKKGGPAAAGGAKPAAGGGKAAAGADGASSSGNGAAANGDGGGSFDIGLPGAEEGKVVTRFPPEPSGYLHIGHAKAALLNQYFADMYKGRLLVRFDDTNPSKEKDEFVENIMKDIADLGLRYEKLTYTSDYFPQLLELGEKLIRAGVMYADDTPVEAMRDQRMKGVESACRGRSVEENLARWEEMKAGSEVGLTNAMRFKMDMKSTNGTMRDPVAFRCNLTHHWRTGHKYKLYPTYDCACPFVDAVEGVTHALRTSEYRDREEQYYWILAAYQKLWPGLPNVHIWDYSRLNFVNTLLSKRKLTWFVETGRVESWNDPRMPTVQGILRRGMRIEALKEFILSQGASKNVTVQEWDKIWTINKKLIDPTCPRHTAVEEEGRVLLTLEGAPEEPEVLVVPRHKKHPPAGKKALTRSRQLWLDQVDAAAVSEGEEVTLMDWGNAIIKTITRDPATGAVTAVSGSLHLAGDFKKTKLKLTWLAAAEQCELVALLLVDFDHLINKKKVEEDDNFMDLVNPTTRFEKAALGDPNMRTLQKGEVLQLERKGYYIVDEPYGAKGAGQPVVLFSIPDGHTKKMSAPKGGSAALP